MAAEAEARADPLEEALVELLELDLAVLEADLAVLEADLLEADLVARLLQAEHLVEEALAAAEVPADLVGPLAVADLVARAAVVAVRIPSLILRMAKFPTRWLLARSPTI